MPPNNRHLFLSPFCQVASLYRCLSFGYDEIKVKFNYKNIALFAATYISLTVLANLIFAIFITEDLWVGLRVLISWPMSLSIASPACLFFPLNPFDHSQGLNCPPSWGLILYNLFFAALSSVLLFNKKLKFNHWIIAFAFLNVLMVFVFILKETLRV